MAQAAFEFSPLPHPTPAPSGALPAPAGSAAAHLDRTGFEIGWDHAHHRVNPPLRHLDHQNPVRQGWAAGRAAFGSRTLKPTAAARQWLALRLEAWLAGQVFEGVQVNPAFLARIDADCCPVSRLPLTLCAGRDSDLQFIRLNTAAAYAAGNLAAVSQRVALARADKQSSGLHGGDKHGSGPHSGQDNPLSADEHARLAVLASFATPLPHGQAALLPLRLLPPNRVRVINPVQALQVMLTLQFTQAGYARRLLALAVLMPGSEARQAFQIFMHTLLARRLSAGQAPSALDTRRAMEDSWADVLVNRRWQRLASRLDAAGCELLLQRAAQRGLVVGGGRWVSPDAATDGWALPAPYPANNTAGWGRSPLAGPGQDQAVAGVVLGAGITRPGKTRSFGSQKLVS